MLADPLLLLLLGATVYVTSGVELQGRSGYNSDMVVDAFPQSSTMSYSKHNSHNSYKVRGHSRGNGSKHVHLIKGHKRRFPGNKFKRIHRLGLLRRLNSRNISCAFVYLKTFDENGTQYFDSDERFQDVRIEVVNQYGSGETSTISPENKYVYDQTGAMYFAVAVITIYGLSIALLIASGMRRSDEDYELKGFIRSFAQLEQARVKKPKDKYKIRKALLESGMLFRITAQGLPRKVLPKLIGCGAPDAASTSKLQGAPLQGDTSGQCNGDYPMGSTGEEVNSANVDQLCDMPTRRYDQSEEGNAREVVPKGNSCPSGPRHVKIYQGKEKGRIDVRSADIALDIPEDSVI